MCQRNAWHCAKIMYQTGKSTGSGKCPYCKDYEPKNKSSKTTMQATNNSNRNSKPDDHHIVWSLSMGAFAFGFRYFNRKFIMNCEYYCAIASGCGGDGDGGVRPKVSLCLTVLPVCLFVAGPQFVSSSLFICTPYARHHWHTHFHPALTLEFNFFFGRLSNCFLLLLLSM